MDRTICTGCDKPKPSNFCWNGMDLDCPFGMPPKNLSAERLWPILVYMHTTIQELIADAEGR